MRMRTVLAIMAAGLGYLAAFAADVNWTGGGDGTTFTDAANWGGALPTTGDSAFATGVALAFTAGEASVGDLNLGAVENAGETTLAISGGTLNANHLFTGINGTAVSHIVQTGGAFNLVATGDPGFAIGRNARAAGVTARDTYTLSDGTLTVAQDSNVNVGSDGYGEMTVTGGEMTCGGYFVIGRYGHGNGLVTLTGGKVALTRGNRHIVLGEEGDGYGELHLSGTAELNASQGVFIRNGKLSLAGNARLVTAALRERYTDRTREVSFDGGTLVAQPANQEAVLDPFMQQLASVTMGDGGLTIEVPAGVTAVIDQPIVAAEGATAAGAGLTKTGAGTLVLKATGNTYLGGTHVVEGALVLASADVLDPATIDYAEGASQLIQSTDSAEAIAAKVAQLDAAKPLTVYVADGAEMTLDAALACSALTKTGPGKLTLTGANAWTGETRVAGGTLVAARGTGVPANSSLVVAGGVWAPLAGAVTAPAAFEPAGSSGFSAVGTPLAVNLQDGAALKYGVDIADRTANGLVLNNAAADQALRFENPLVLSDANEQSIRVESANENAVATLAGAITRRDGDPVTVLHKYGAGTLRLEAPMDMLSTHYRGNEGHTIFGPGVDEAKMRDLIISNGGTGKIEPGAKITSTGWVYVGLDGAASTLDINGYLYSNGFLRSGQNGSNGTVNIGEGAEVNVDKLYIGHNSNSSVNQTGGTLLVRGGDNRIGGWDDGNTGTGVYNLSGGLFEVHGNFQVGAFRKGSFVQSGLGNTVATGWTSMGRYRKGTGVMDIGAGLWDQTGCAVIAGEQGDGTVDVHATGVLRTPYLRLCQYDFAHGRVHVTDGGRVETNYIQFNGAQARTGLADFAVDGGTLAARVDRRNFLTDDANLAVGPKGLTFDTGDKTVGLAYPEALQGGPVTKVGSGTFQLGSHLPRVSTFTVQEGTLAYQGAPTSKGLVHRWTFDEDLTDSVGGQTGTSLGGLTFANGAMKMAGGNKGTSGVDLGADILPKEGPVTLEFWLSIDTGLTWSKAITIGKDTGNHIIFTGCTNGADGDTSLGMSGFMGNDTATGFAERGKEFHYAITWEPDGVSGTYVTATRRDATTGELLGLYRGYSETFRIANIEQNHGYLGRTFWGDPDLAGTFRELRVWDRALTMTQQRTSALAGPDTVPDFDTTPAEDNVVAENAGDQVLAHRWSFDHGSLFDTAGGRLATTEDGSEEHVNVTVIPRAFDGIKLAGGGKGSSLIDLGADVLPKEGPVTIELWFIVNEHRGWSQILDFGSDTGNYLVIGQAFNGDGDQKDKCFLSINSAFNDAGTLGRLEIGREYHAAVTLVPVEGGTQVALTIRKAGSAESFGAVTRLVEGWTIGASLNQRNCWLGRSQWGDPDASVTYNELRVWRAALSDAQLVKNAQNGPDVLPQLAGAVPANGADLLAVAADATVDLQNTTASVNGVTGSGTIKNGTLEIAGTVDPVDTLTLQTTTALTGTYLVDAEDLLVCDGDLDLTQATIKVRDAKSLKGQLTIATATGKITGPAKADNLKGTGYGLFYSEQAVRIGPVGTILIFR